MAHVSRQTLESMGFATIGENVLISEKASIYGAARIRLGDNVRIDDYCVLSAGQGGIDIGSYVHIAVYCSLIGSARIRLDDFAGLSGRVSIYSSSDDYTGAALTNPTVPVEYTQVHSADVHIGRHVIVGTGSVILPGVVLAEGVAIGALSFVHRSCDAFGIYTGNPLRRLKDRGRDLLDAEAKLIASQSYKPR